MMALKAMTFVFACLAAYAAPINYDIDAAVMQPDVKVASEDRAEMEQLSMAMNCLGDVSVLQLDFVGPLKVDGQNIERHEAHELSEASKEMQIKSQGKKGVDYDLIGPESVFEEILQTHESKETTEHKQANEERLRKSRRLRPRAMRRRSRRSRGESIARPPTATVWENGSAKAMEIPTAAIP